MPAHKIEQKALRKYVPLLADRHDQRVTKKRAKNFLGKNGSDSGYGRIQLTKAGRAIALAEYGRGSCPMGGGHAKGDSAAARSLRGLPCRVWGARIPGRALYANFGQRPSERGNPSLPAEP